MKQSTEPSKPRVNPVLFVLRFICGIPGVIVAQAVRTIAAFFNSFKLILPAAKGTYNSPEAAERLPDEDRHLYEVLNVAGRLPELIAPVLKKVPRLNTVLSVIAIVLFGLIAAPIYRSFAIAINAWRLLPSVAACKYDDPLHFLRLSREKQMLYKIIRFFCNIPNAIGRGVVRLGLAVWGIIKKIYLGIADIVMTFKNGSWSTRVSYVLMGTGSIVKGQPLRGALFMLFEVVFIFYMIVAGNKWLYYLPSLGLRGPEQSYNVILDTYTTVTHDNSFKILLYGVLTIFFILAFLYTWRVNVKQNKILDQIHASGKKVKSGK
ncbi:MAG: hypothetical protein II920_08630, partial [Clostridia bacterium]|nr:hypothetical protein [Clostridia bacterium]